MNALHEYRRAVADELFILFHRICLMTLGSKHIIAAVSEIGKGIEQCTVEVEDDGFVHRINLQTPKKAR